MSRITGVVSRSVPLNGVISRSLTLTGTYDLYVSPDELVAIRPYLDLLASSGVLTGSAIYQDSDSLLQGTVGVASDAAISTVGNVAVADLLIIPIAIPDAATTTYTYKTLEKIEIVDVVVRKSVAGAANTITVQDSAAVAISDAIVAAVDKVVTRAGTLDPAKTVIVAGGTFKILATRAAGSMLAQVWVYAVKR